MLFWSSTHPRLSKAPKGNAIGAAGSKNLGLVLRPLCSYTVALGGVAYRRARGGASAARGQEPKGIDVDDI